ncbi:MAG: hypothetical protein ACYS1C_07665, partial [Planctomycetota bacterium]
MGVPVLHCYADYKWTGPSEPVVRLCQELTARGWRADLACMTPPPHSEPELATRAREAELAALETFCYGTRPGLRRTVRDYRSLLRMLARHN